MKRINSFLLIFIFCAVFLIGCDDTINDPLIRPIPDSNISFSKDLLPLFNLKCSYSGCHNDQDKAAGLDLTSYNGIKNKSFVVIANDSNGSLLVQKLKSGHPIDLTYPGFTKDEIDAVVTWIDEGAKNN